MKDHYATLGIPHSASQDEVKKAFHKAAHQHHPDKGGSADKFKAASEAYAVLSSPEKRRHYDLIYSPRRMEDVRRTTYHDPNFWEMNGSTNKAAETMYNQMMDNMIRKWRTDHDLHMAEMRRKAATKMQSETIKTAEKIIDDAMTDMFKQHKWNHYKA